MITWTPTVLSVLYACVSYCCICTCSAQLSMFHMDRRSRNTLIIIIIIIINLLRQKCVKIKQGVPPVSALDLQLTSGGKRKSLGKKRNYFLSVLLMWTSFKISKERCTSLSNLHQRKTYFVSDVSVNQTTGRRWQTKLLDTWTVAQIHGR